MKWGTYACEGCPIRGTRSLGGQGAEPVHSKVRKRHPEKRELRGLSSGARGWLDRKPSGRPGPYGPVRRERSSFDFMGKMGERVDIDHERLWGRT